MHLKCCIGDIMILRELTWGKEPVYYVQKSYRKENGKPATKHVERLGTMSELGGVVEAVGAEVTKVKPGNRVAVNVETFCGECFYCKRRYVNNYTSGGWMLGCRIDGGQAEFVRVPYADNGLTQIPTNVSNEQALFVGDILTTDYWVAKISEISEEDTVLIIGAGPTASLRLPVVKTLLNSHGVVFILMPCYDCRIIPVR